MIEVEERIQTSPAIRWKRAAWLFGILARPLSTLRAIVAEDKGNWQLPLILLTLLALGSVFAAGPLRIQAAQANPPELPESFQWMSPEQQEQYLAAQASAYGSTQTYVFPAVGGVLGVWVGFLVLGGLLHLILTMLGSRSSSTTAYNLVGWASVPLILRQIVRIVYMLSAHRLISTPGLTGFVAADVQGAAAFGRVLLGLVDIYLIWQVILLWLGASVSGGLSRRRAFSGVLIAVLLFLALSALPAFFGAQLSGLESDRPFFLF